MKALVVDDNPRIRRCLTRLLAFRGLVAETAADGEEALELCERDAFAVAISDLDMPRMNGVELARRLRQRWPEMVLLGFTGSSGDGLRLAAEAVFDRMFDKWESAEVAEVAARLAVETCGCVEEATMAD